MRHGGCEAGLQPGGSRARPHGEPQPGQAVLARQLVRPPLTDLFEVRGRAWLASLEPGRPGVDLHAVVAADGDRLGVADPTPALRSIVIVRSLSVGA